VKQRSFDLLWEIYDAVAVLDGIWKIKNIFLLCWPVLLLERMDTE